MTEYDLTELQQRKKTLREQAHANRNAQPDKEEVSKRICAKLVGSPEYRAARTVMYYVDVRSEVHATSLPEARARAAIVVPWCRDGELELFHLESMDELAIGATASWSRRWSCEVAAKRLKPEELDLVMVPGVAFDGTGARMGHGFGYYDKLLQHARLDAPLVALAFECQLFESIPTQAHDIFMDRIITEKAVYPGRGRKSPENADVAGL
jgi:5-formyltetrahydrofolate cyclo-ligase